MNLVTIVSRLCRTSPSDDAVEIFTKKHQTHIFSHTSISMTNQNRRPRGVVGGVYRYPRLPEAKVSLLPPGTGAPDEMTDSTPHGKPYESVANEVARRARDERVMSSQEVAMSRFLSGTPMGSTLMMFLGVGEALVLGSDTQLWWLSIAVGFAALIVIITRSRSMDLRAPARVAAMAQVIASFVAGLIAVLLTTNIALMATFDRTKFLSEAVADDCYAKAQITVVLAVVLGGLAHFFFIVIAHRMSEEV